MKKEYQLLVWSDPDYLSKLVTAMLGDGWELWGNPTMSQDAENGLANKLFGQALVRFEGEADELLGHLDQKMTTGFNVGTPTGEFQRDLDQLEEVDLKGTRIDD